MRVSRFNLRAGFTLTELLVVIGIIAILIAILVTSTSAARRESRTVQCQNNIRQLAQGLLMYAGANKGKFPPNRPAPLPGQWWYEDARLGAFIPAPRPNEIPDVSVYVCPDDDEARRSYSMNLWASSKVDSSFTMAIPKQGELWSANVKRGSELVLLIEAWAYQGSPSTGYSSPPVIGGQGDAGQRFGGGGGLTPMTTPRFGPLVSEVTYARHRRSGGAGNATQPQGRTVVAFADQHVQILSNAAIVNFETGELTGLCYWSPLDFK